MKAYDYHGYKYCQDCAAILDTAIITDGEEIVEADFPAFTPCDECGYDVFGRDAEDAVFPK
jgi:hypothetical protein